jgi:hypothetical protein
MMSLMRFTLVAMDFNLFSMKSQNNFIGTDFKDEIKQLAPEWNTI